MKAARIEAKGLPADHGPEFSPQLSTQCDAHTHHERAVRHAYERGREDSPAFPALLVGLLIGAISAVIVAWIL